MKKYDLLRFGDNIIRVLEIQDDSILVIDCIKRTMPRWVEMAALESYSECTIDELSEITGLAMVSTDDLDADQRSGTNNQNDVRMKNIRSTRRREQTKRHRDYMKEGSSRE